MVSFKLRFGKHHYSTRVNFHNFLLITLFLYLSFALGVCTFLDFI
ncbi:Uncharacterised protein [Acinetobacter baumannii]|nr:Uncharacterised protein [Acinetobacter baumannii]SSU95358.1 Uncharacterised protein [Acinetobacter baumannii]